MQLLLYILVTFVRCLKCGIKYGLLNLAQWLSNSGYFIYMKKNVYSILHITYVRGA